MATKWYIVTTYSGYENKVRSSLAERVKTHKMESSFGEILVPTEAVHEIVRGKKRIANRKFFPGYIFVQMEMREDSWQLVKNTSKVTGFIGNQKPSAVPDSEIARLTQQIAEGQMKPKARISFEDGDHVRVNEGPFANFTGTIEEVKHDKQKVRVLVSIFGRATPVELDFAHVEKTV